MPLKQYGVLVGRPVDRRLATSNNAHYQIKIVDDLIEYRAAINVMSKAAPSEVLYLLDENYAHPVLAGLHDLAPGFHRLNSQPGGSALDFVRGNLFDKTLMRPLPFNVPGTDNDLNEKLDRVVQQALSDEEALVYVFGERWGPEPQTRDKIFGFLPGNGVHDVHMNQGNIGQWVRDDGIYQDGALFIRFPARQQWMAVFLAFQSQAWETDEQGHRLPVVEPPPPTLPVTGGTVRIIAALVNPLGGDQGKETVTLLNVSPQPVNLNGWQLADRFDKRHRLSGTIAAGQTLVVTLPIDVALGNNGGICNLLDNQGRKIHGISYTKEQAAREGWTLAF
jgi:uncharacterized protein YukJ